MNREELKTLEEIANQRKAYKSLLLIDEIRVTWEIIDDLENALKLVKSDAEKNGFVYGQQSVCEKALTKTKIYKHNQRKPHHEK